MGHDQVQRTEDADKNPEHHQPKADHANGTVKQLAIKPQPSLERDRRRIQDDQCNPHWHQLMRHGPQDTRIGAHEGPQQDIENHDRHHRQQRPA